jgi:hypothetical protein
MANGLDTESVGTENPIIIWLKIGTTLVPNMVYNNNNFLF